MEPPRTFPQLQVLDPAANHSFIRPVKRIHDGPDVDHFLRSKAYRDIGIFVMQLNRALCPRKKSSASAANATQSSGLVPTTTAAETFPLSSSREEPEIVQRIQSLLSTVGEIIGEAPPDPGPRRFGNISFRKWHSLLEERTDSLLAEHLPQEVLRTGSDTNAPGDTTLEEIKAYFLGGFGSAQRLDYGTGHELSFLAFLGCLWKLGAFQGSSRDGSMERSISLGIIEPYLSVVRRLILIYTLEPAGSHGVWGLDDHSFIPYILGSAQLTRPISPDEPMPLEGSVRGAPKPSDVVKPDVIERQRHVNMYFSAIGFIFDVKKGPFWEHSPILFDISGIKDGWGKINKGMIKMFNAEVLGKFPVVQHFPFGSLFSWDEDPEAIAPVSSVHLANQPSKAVSAGVGSSMQQPNAVGGVVGTSAPWAQAGRMPGVAVSSSAGGIPYSRAPWAAMGGASTPHQTTRRPGNVADDAPASLPRGNPGTTSSQMPTTRAPWAKPE